MKSNVKSQREYPWTERVGNEEFSFRLMTPADEEEMLAFTRALPAQDVMFLRKDITKEAVVDDWIEKIRKDQTVTVIAETASGVIAGYASLHLDQLLWTHHLGEIRVVLAKDMRGKGLARRLVNEMFQIARDRGLQRLVVNMRRDQEHVRAMLNKLGFKAEALLTDWLMDANGVTHDLLVMSCYVNEV
jgi:L-amino acid N-acyltransferase YncA